MLKNKLKFHSKFVNVNLVLRLLCGSAFIRVCGCSHHGATVIRCHIPMHHLYYFLMGIVFILSILGMLIDPNFKICNFLKVIFKILIFYRVNEIVHWPILFTKC